MIKLRKSVTIALCLVCLISISVFSGLTIYSYENDGGAKLEVATPKMTFLDNGRPYAMRPIIKPVDNGRPY